MNFFRLVRMLALITVLVVVAGTQWLSARKLSSWSDPIWVTVYPVIPAGADAAAGFAENLDGDDFGEVDRFLVREAARHGRTLSQALVFQVAPSLREAPPSVPVEGDWLGTALWSLRLRWWAWRRDRDDGLPSADAQIFLTLNPTDRLQSLDRSVGLRKGSIGLVNGYAGRSMAPVNQVVMAHELLHLFGASDKYEPLTGQPLEPHGLAQPDRQPLYPQSLAEIMGGRIATSASTSVIPRSLARCRVGQATAEEIGWR